MNRLEYLELNKLVIASESLAYLDGLIDLKSLTLVGCINGDLRDDALDVDDPPLLGRLPTLPELEVLDLEFSAIGDRDLHHLAVLSRLKSLNLARTAVSSAGLAELASQESLEELAVYDGMDEVVASTAGLQSLLAVKRLKKLHIERSDSTYDGWSRLATLALDNDGTITVPAGEADDYLRALRALRQSKPGIVIDDGGYPHRMSGPPTEPIIPWEAEWNAEFFQNLRVLSPADRATFSLEELKNLKW